MEPGLVLFCRMQQKLLVIGAGWAGISAAMAAAQLGWQVTMVEERGFIGGRARSFTHAETETVIDNGQHVMMGAYSASHQILSELGTAYLLEKQPALRVAFVRKNGKQAVLNAAWLPGQAGMAAGLLALTSIPMSARLACLSLATRILTQKIQTNNQTCAEFLSSQRQPYLAIKNFWEPLILATLNAPISVVDARLLVNVLRLAFLGGREAASLWIPTVGLSALLEPFGQWLSAHDGTLLTSTAVNKLEFCTADSERGLGVQASLSNGSTIQTHAVVSAIPLRALTRIAQSSELSMPLPAAVPLSPIVSVYLWYESTWMTVDFTAALGTTIQWIFNKHRIRPGLVALTVSAANELATLDVNELVKHCTQELESLYPQLHTTALLASQVIKEKHATPVITPQFEAERTQFMKWHAAHSTINGSGFVISGDWTVPGLPATIEAAARSGAMAVQRLARPANAE